jgi:hypothetical protein
MNENSGTPDEPRQYRQKEYQDPHYHDEDEVSPVEDDRQPRGSNLPRRRKPTRKLPPRRHDVD